MNKIANWEWVEFGLEVVGAMAVLFVFVLAITMPESIPAIMGGYCLFAGLWYYIYAENRGRKYA